MEIFKISIHYKYSAIQKMDYPKDPYHQQQHPYPQQPFVGQGVPLGSDQMQYNYPQNQMPPPHNQYPYQQPQNYGMPPPPPPMIAPGNVVIVGKKKIFLIDFCYSQIRIKLLKQDLHKEDQKSSHVEDAICKE